MEINNETKVVPYESLKHCLRSDDLTICNSMIQEQFITPKDCLENIIDNKGNSPCEYKVLETKNYYMEISKTLLYCFIISPLKLQVICNDRNLVYELNETNLISYGEDCNIYKLYDSNETNGMVKNFAVDFSYCAPNFTVYDNVLQNWTYDYTLINKRNIENLNAQKLN